MIYLGADHGGYQLKEKIKEWLAEWKLPYKDLGASKLIPGDDYPQYAFAVAEKAAGGDDMTKPWQKRAKGILACRSAGGMVVAANKIKDVRAVAVGTTDEARLAREKNDANVIVLAGDWINDSDAKKIIKIWLDTEFSGDERHRRRVNQIREKEFECGCG